VREGARRVRQRFAAVYILVKTRHPVSQQARGDRLPKWRRVMGANLDGRAVLGAVRGDGNEGRSWAASSTKQLRSPRRPAAAAGTAYSVAKGRSARSPSRSPRELAAHG